MQRRTPFTDNVVLNATEDSYELHAELSTQTNAKLSDPAADPDLYAEYHPFHLAFMAAFNGWKAQGGTQKGSTSQLNTMLKGLPKAAYDWAYVIEGVYAKNTSQYMTLFPKGRTVFSTGTQLSRISAVSQLSINLTGITSLATVKTSVDAMVAALTTINNSQKAQKAMTDAKSSAVETQRIASGKAMFSILGSLMKKYADEPERVKDFFPVDLLYKTRQRQFTGHLAVDAVKMIAKRTLRPDAQLTLSNNSTVDVSVEFYMAATKDGAIPAGTIPVVVPQGLSIKVPASMLGHLSNKYLTVRNTSDLGEADWAVLV